METVRKLQEEARGYMRNLPIGNLSNHWEMAIYFRDHEGLGAFDPMTRLALYLIHDCCVYELKLINSHEEYVMSRILRPDSYHITDEGPWYFKSTESLSSDRYRPLNVLGQPDHS